MYRYKIEELVEWKNKKNRKPLIIEGARQVGKTWLMKEFAEKHYSKQVYINFDSNEIMKELFSIDLDVSRIILGIEIYIEQKIDATDTLLIFDEIQEVPKALTSLKYFCENAPQYHIVCAGSMLGIALHNTTSFPVGKVEFLSLYPLSFKEFLLAMGKEKYVELLDKEDYKMISSFSTLYIDMLKQYYFIGGMPEVVLEFSINKDFNEVRNIQKRILKAYDNDFSKHAPREDVPKIRMLFNSIPIQIAKENKKFIYRVISESARAKEYELALLWLIDCGLIHKVNCVNIARLPLNAYNNLRAFKLFLLDVGLLTCMSGLKQQVLLDKNNLFVEFKGALTEQYVLQELVAFKDLSIYYYTNDRATAEIDFLIDNGSDIIPLEVKAEKNTKAKSLKVYCEKYNPKLSIISSLISYSKSDKILNLPLYCLGNIDKFL